MSLSLCLSLFLFLFSLSLFLSLSVLLLFCSFSPVKEMKALQCLYALSATKAREKEYGEFLSDLDNQVWKENVRSMAKIPDGERRKPCHVIQRCAQQCG